MTIKVTWCLDCDRAATDYCVANHNIEGQSTEQATYESSTEQPRPEQAGGETWCVCSHAKYNHGEDDFSSQGCNVRGCDCDSFELSEHDAPAAPERGERWRVVREPVAPIVAEIRAGDQIVVGAVSTEIAEQIVREHEQHSTLIAQRDRLIHVLQVASSTLKSYQYGNVSPELAKEMIRTIEQVLTTIEQEGTGP